MTSCVSVCTTCLAILLLPPAACARGLPLPERIYSDTRPQTKTYMHQCVESPDGTKYAFRLFPGEDQPGRNDGSSRCEIWLCNSDLTGHYKAFTSPKDESEHGSDVIVWISNDLIFYAGISYRIGTHKVLWQFEGRSSTVPLARMGSVNPNKLYVGIRGRGGTESHNKVKGWYWLDPSSPTKPKLHLVSDMKDLVKHYKGSWGDAEATYIYQNPSDTRLFVVVYDRKKGQEFAFILNASDGSIRSFLGSNAAGRCNNGHVLWYDDNTLFAGNQQPGLFDLTGKLINRLAGKGEGNHISISPDKQWWVADIHREHVVRLYKFGSRDSVVISGDIKGHHHPSFSRDGRYVFFQGKNPSEPHMGVYRVDVSSITNVRNRAAERSEQDHAPEKK